MPSTTAIAFALFTAAGNEYPAAIEAALTMKADAEDALTYPEGVEATPEQVLADRDAWVAVALQLRADQAAAKVAA
jgi:hypothetical protein